MYHLPSWRVGIAFYRILFGGVLGFLRQPNLRAHFLAKRRFEEAWMLLDDPAQEMDQPSFRELVRLLETLLRLHGRYELPLTLIVALHQEERALDATRATNGQLYILGWQQTQRQDTAMKSSVKKVELLAPGYFPLKPEKVFSR
jgi:hypothetical protein